MHGVVLREFGPAENLRCEELPDRTAEPGWVSVHLRASALNWHDVLVREGKYNSALPHVPGADGAGVRADTGEDVLILPSLWWGDDERAPAPDWEILGDHHSGTYAEQVVVPVECAVPKPKSLNWHQAAALPLVGLTTYRALFARGGLKKGESVLILGAGGGVATMAIQLAAACGAKVVVTSSSSEKIQRARELGASEGVLYTENEWWCLAREASPGGYGFDVVLDTVGSWQESIRVLRAGGRAVVLGASLRSDAVLDVRNFYFGQYDLLGTTMGSPADFAGLISLIETGRVGSPIVDSVFPLDRAAEAHEYLERGGVFGKVVLDHC